MKTCPRCFKDVEEGAHTCSGKTPSPGTREYERMVDAGERAALDSEMAAGQEYSEENAVVTLRRIMDARVERREYGTPITLQPDTCRYLLAHIDRLLLARRELHRMRNADLARRMAESNATLKESLSGKPCPTCTKPLPEGTL